MSFKKTDTDSLLFELNSHRVPFSVNRTPKVNCRLLQGRRYTGTSTTGHSTTGRLQSPLECRGGKKPLSVIIKVQSKPKLTENTKNRKY